MPTEKKRGAENGQAQARKEQLTIPKFEPMAAPIGAPPESAIGTRIEFCRKQLGLSIEALARYTARFDKRDNKGISPTSLLRYEAGEYEPGAREIRILCDTFDASPRWLIYGLLDNAGEDAIEQTLIKALESYVVERAKEPRLEGDIRLSKVFDKKPTIEERLDWLAKAKRPGQTHQIHRISRK